jgi:Zn-finger nucleic acid-binding protein
MLVVNAGETLGSVELDVCDICYVIWFDEDELTKIPRASDDVVSRSERDLDRRMRQGSPAPTRMDYYDDGDTDLLDDIFDLVNIWIRSR